MGTYPPKDCEDLVAKYEKFSHETLYEGLKAGDPNQVDGLLADWKKIVSGVHDMNTNLSGELKNLAKEWSSSSGDEFHRRMGLIARFAGDLATDIGEFHDTLQDANGQLREAKKHNEDPEDTDDNGQAMGGAAKGAAIGSVAGPVGTLAGGVIGGIMGHNKDEEQKKAAKNRMVQLIAQLAGTYQGAAGQWHVTNPDKDLPGHDLHDRSKHPGSADPGSGTTAPPGTHDDTQHDKDHKVDDRYHRLDDHSHDTPPSTTHDPSRDIGDVNGPGAGGSVLTGAGAGPTGAGFGAGLGGGTGAGAASSPSGASGGGVPGGVFANAGGGTAGATGGRGAVRPRGAAGGRGSGEGEGEEYSTWLTEDEEVWGGDEEAATGLLGGRPHADDWR
ncbi:hypothetical protein Athai_57240 [Actinocatenispora thailandica]|uniref:WXG100 family type VII secretion target n=1 Tax=Actinocatenispora thailandica TaxID=227318 RepID=A0A7R7DUW3_9ACTN|nr:hypothetical protein [Actinocatenispora thailandica]BCJ38221.1 hypothetical protein Athai_57240 [Actinocatenispora thailandica]